MQLSFGQCGPGAARGRAIAAEVMAAPGVEPVVCMAVAAAVLPLAAELTVTRLRALVRAELVAHDAAYAERRRRAAERHADARLRADPGGVAGRAVLEADVSVQDAHACWDRAGLLARAAGAAGDPRPIGMLRAETVRDRIIGPSDAAGTHRSRRTSPSSRRWTPSSTPPQGLAKTPRRTRLETFSPGWTTGLDPDGTYTVTTPTGTTRTSRPPGMVTAAAERAARAGPGPPGPPIEPDPPPC